MDRRRIFDAFRQARRSMPEGSPPPGEWIPLADAARALRIFQRDSDLDLIARNLSDNEESLLAFWARRVTQLGVPVYGRRIMSNNLAAIPAAVILAGKIYDEAMRLDVGQGEPTQDFCALQVKRHEFEACLAAMSDADKSRL